MMLQNNGLIEVNASWFCAILNKYIYDNCPDGVVEIGGGFNSISRLVFAYIRKLFQ